MFPFSDDKRCSSVKEALTLYNCGNIKMHEMGDKFKCCRRKTPFVLTEFKIACGVCEDCEFRVGQSQDHPLTFNEAG